MILLESYPPPPLTLGEISVLLIFFGVLLVVFSLRRIPIFAGIWKLIVIFFIVLLGTLMWGSIKEGVKKDIKDVLK